MTKQIYKKFFTRDFTLANVEIWACGESAEPRSWTKDKLPYMPYLVFERADNVVNCYMDPEGIKWIKEKLFDQVKKDKRFVSKIINAFYKRIKKFKHIWGKPHALDRVGFRNYVTTLKHDWPWFEALYWLGEILPHGKDLDKVLRARKYSESEGEGTDIVIRESVKRLYPSLEKYVDVLQIEEILTGKIPSQIKLKMRKKKYYYVCGSILNSLRELEKMFPVEIEKGTAAVGAMCHGQTGYPGIVRGLVRIITTKEKIPLFQVGEVLIAPMTTPDFLPALKKASAFVTDEGGVMCHAAIVARELRKPCVIGTRAATKIFKDGDVIEVDAVHGIVRKIK